LERAKKEEESTSDSSVGASASQQQIVITQSAEEKIPKFTGDFRRFREWLQFFDSYVHQKKITNIEKLKKLKDSLVGPAARDIAHIDLKGELYETALRIIKRKYGDVDEAEDAHMRIIQKVCSSWDTRSPDKLRSFVSQISQNVHALIAIGNSSKTLSVSVTSMILSALPKNLVKSFLRSYKASKNNNSGILESDDSEIELKSGKQLEKLKLDLLLKFLEEEVKTEIAAVSFDNRRKVFSRREINFDRSYDYSSNWFKASETKNNHAF